MVPRSRAGNDQTELPACRGEAASLVLREQQWVGVLEAPRASTGGAACQESVAWPLGFSMCACL